MPRQTAVEAIQAQHGDQQGTHAQIRGREPLQVRNPKSHPTIFLVYAIQGKKKNSVYELQD